MKNGSELMRPGAWCMVLWFCFTAIAVGDDEEFFRKRVAPILERSCLECHQGDDPSGGLSFTDASSTFAGGESGEAISPGDPDGSLLLDYIVGDEPEMPIGGQRLDTDEIGAIRKWIADGAVWPNGMTLEPTWWSFEPLTQTPIPATDSDWARTPIDHFILDQLKANGLSPSPKATRQTLIRRLCFDLTGLPPTPAEVDAFVNDDRPSAYGQLVDRLLKSPRYGERWARHWLDVVHYGDTHGYDKDKVRLNAWPYRDYVIRAFNEDKPYKRFVMEQLAGDVLFPETRDGVVATGFIAAGPFDFVGHSELKDGLIDKDITRNLDRDDMVSTTMNSFTSLTAQCARCHDHKFDPISQEDYYSLQAVFAGVERADRPYPDETGASMLESLERSKKRVNDRILEIVERIDRVKTPEIKMLEKVIEELRESSSFTLAEEGQTKSKTLGYHSKVESAPEKVKWVQVDLGASQWVDSVVLFPAHVVYGGHSGPGFGFPVRFKVEMSDDVEFRESVHLAGDFSLDDFENPGDIPLEISVDLRVPVRYLRVTASALWERTQDYAFALAELQVFTDGKNVANGAAVTSLDTIESGQWSTAFLVDGFDSGVLIPGFAKLKLQIVEHHEIRQQREDDVKKLNQLMAALIDDPTRLEIENLKQSLAEIEATIGELPPLPLVYAATRDFEPIGNFRPPPGGIPREIRLLHRGEVGSPGVHVEAGTVGLIDSLASRFEMDDPTDERQRRLALAQWVVHDDNPLTWRSIVNRIWHYHFGRGIVESPNDFGRMGTLPTHPQLLDWLAVEFRDGGDAMDGQSLKQLHRLIVMSAVYQQASGFDERKSEIDAGNRFLWRMNRRRLEAEAIHDAVLVVAGKLDTTMGGPGYRAFGFVDDHSPRYDYLDHDPDDPASHRRSVYRLVVRSVPDPFMDTLDCADPSQAVAKRNETLTALQALALLNNRFMLRMSEHLADRVAPEDSLLAGQIQTAFKLAMARDATESELSVLNNYARQHGMPAACRLLFNMNEFVFVD